jgi:hypothetical protein
MDSTEKPDPVELQDWIRANWRRVAEVFPLALLIWGIGLSATEWNAVVNEYNRQYNPSEKESVFQYWPRQDWLELLTLAAWTTSPIWLRPLSHCNATLRQRYVVVCLIVAAGLYWFAMDSWRDLGIDLTLYPRIKSWGWKERAPSLLSMLLVPALLATAGYHRLGWEKESSSDELSGA